MDEAGFLLEQLLDLGRVEEGAILLLFSYPLASVEGCFPDVQN